ncbi:hypothetical protein GCM10023191_087670 [Actinoallomurus oryzae]|uniref:Uncharacterized protein n=1 Tax=Actinoallomurus oryzae TaxID=502180 RepID=A0ABP8R2M3_9ACTN
MVHQICSRCATWSGAPTGPHAPRHICHVAGVRCDHGALRHHARSSPRRDREEFDRLGRDAFLEKHGFDSSRRYWLRYDGARYDSKAIAGVAHGHLPGRSPLAAKDFSGGIGHAVTVLRRLGFEVTSEADADPIGLQTAGEIASAIGGLRCASVAGKPMLKQAVVLLWAIGRARAGHDRLLGWADTTGALTPLLQTHRRDGERREGRPDYPIAALFHAGLWDLPGHTDVPRAHGDAAVRTWFAEHAPDGGLPWSVYALARRSGTARVRMIDAITTRFLEDFDESGLLAAAGLYDEDVATDEAPPSGGPGQETAPGSTREDSRAEYARLCELVTCRESRTYGQRRTRTVNDPIRISTARSHARLRRPGERAIAQLKSWEIWPSSAAVPTAPATSPELSTSYISAKPTHSGKTQWLRGRAVADDGCPQAPQSRNHRSQGSTPMTNTAASCKNDDSIDKPQQKR